MGAAQILAYGLQKDADWNDHICIDWVVFYVPGLSARHIAPLAWGAFSFRRLSFLDRLYDHRCISFNPKQTTHLTYWPNAKPGFAGTIGGR